MEMEDIILFTVFGGLTLASFNLGNIMVTVSLFGLLISGIFLAKKYGGYLKW